ncbi:MAG: TldD/PmbA family protein [Desulfobacterota bacterium]|nr:TldD/PmbA family protein [Thermodesulfobacteriota bacterium]
MDLEKVQRLVKKEFDGYEIFYLRETVKKLESRRCELYNFEFSREEGIALRALRGKKLAFSYTFGLEDEDLKRLIKKTEEIFPYLEEDEAYEFPEKRKKEEYPELQIYDKDGEDLDLEEKLERLLKMERTIREDRRIVATRHLELLESTSFVEILNSNGLYVSGRKTLYTVSALAVAKDLEEVSWYDLIWSHRFEDLNFLEFGEMVREKAISFLSSKKLRTGTYNGVLRPRVASALLSILSSSFLGENLYKEKTRLKGKINEKCFSELLDIENTGTFGPSSFPFDGEGFPSISTKVVSGGYFQAFLYDSYYAKKLGTSSTGNCVRQSLPDMPRCGIRGLFIREDGGEFPELSEGEIVLEDLMGTHTANPVTGEFSLGTLGFIKEKGRLVPFQGVMISGNVFEVFENVRAIGKDLKFYGNYGSPSLFVEGLRISGS